MTSVRKVIYKSDAYRAAYHAITAMETAMKIDDTIKTLEEAVSERVAIIASAQDQVRALQSVIEDLKKKQVRHHVSCTEEDIDDAKQPDPS